MTEVNNNNRRIYISLKVISQLDQKHPDGKISPEDVDVKERDFLSENLHALDDMLSKLDINEYHNLFVGENIVDKANRVYPRLEDIRKSLQRNLQSESKNESQREFNKFGSDDLGTKEQRIQTSDALSDAMNSNVPKQEKVEFPKDSSAGRTASEIVDDLSKNGNLDYIEKHSGLQDDIQKDINEFLKQSQQQLEKENPFVEEEQFVGDVEQKSDEGVGKSVVDIINGYGNLKSVKDYPSNVDMDFYSKKFEDNLKELEKNSDPIKKRKLVEMRDALSKSMKKDMKESLEKRKLEWYNKRLEDLRLEYMKRLRQQIENYRKLESILGQFAAEDEFGGLWDLSRGELRKSGFEYIKKFADLLEKDESLRELAQMLGRQNNAQTELEKAYRDKVSNKTEYHSCRAYRGSICGVKQSNDISSVFPSELAQFKYPATKRYFQLKFAQKQLLSYDYENLTKDNVSETGKEEIQVPKKEEKGPIMICVDTSGSMYGTPEQVAKTITFALTKIAIREKRKCYLISFSTGIHTLELNDTKKGNVLNNLLQFLSMSFNGGTDANPALTHAVKKLGENDWKNADVLMVSDFCMDDLNDRLKKAIKEEKQKGTKFHSLTIGGSASFNHIVCFDHNWTYSNTPNGRRQLAEQIRQVSKHK